MPPSSSIGGYMPSAYQSRCPLSSKRFDFVMCGRVDEVVARLDVTLPRVVLHDPADRAALRVEDREPGTDLVREREQVELRAELAVVAALGLLEPVQVLLERLVALPRGPVDALEHRALLVAPPVRARDLGQLERAELAGGRDVRAAAQVDVGDGAVGAEVLVDADRAVAHDLARVVLVGRTRADVADDLLLVRLVREQLEPAVEVVLLADERLVLGDDLADARLDALEVRVREVPAVGELEVVVEAVRDRRADRVLRSREQVEDRLGHHVRDVEWRRTSRPSSEFAVMIATVASCSIGRVEVHLVAVDRGRDRSLGQPLADRRRDVTRRRALRAAPSRSRPAA